MRSRSRQHETMRASWLPGTGASAWRSTIGLSLAIIPLLMLWTSTLGLRWSQAAVLVGAGLTCSGSGGAYLATAAKRQAAEQPRPVARSGPL